MLTNDELIVVEEKYYKILYELLSKNIGSIITQIYSQTLVNGAATTNVTNTIEKSVENVIEGLIAKQLQWNICSLPVSADSCFECGDAIVQIDAKTCKINDVDNTSNKVNVENTQTTYCNGVPLNVAGKNWNPKLNKYENHNYFGEIPNITYIVKVVYSNANRVEKIKLISLPHGQLNTVFNGAAILGAGRSKGTGALRSNIRFSEDQIVAVQSWRVNTIYERK